MFDVIIIGGSFAGLSAALQLARTRRPIAIIDAGSPRNRFASHAHSVLAQDGKPGGTILAEARAQLVAYPNVTQFAGTVRQAEPLPSGKIAFTITLDDGRVLQGRRLILATGVRDLLPELPGVAERWGQTVLHCPYCHGYEIGGGNIGVLGRLPASVHQASLIADWGDVTLFTAGMEPLDDDAMKLLARRKVKLEHVAVTAIEGAAPAIDGARLADGRLVPLRALFLAAPVQQASGLAMQLGCALEEGMMGPIVQVDAMKMTSVPGVHAAGDAARAMANITFAMADGVMAAVAAHHAMIAEEGQA
ncbi:NAD(P)/FAD-dependent oxidoreductase [Janthinobacterium sp. HLX7-2]|uniref:NAD(P)/FAD-dependent oxidoreductase n=1 Tax=Janthinobacterium sp. HLX7-2 TaxID=1259331 RepID=UPI003F276F6B